MQSFFVNRRIGIKGKDIVVAARSMSEDVKLRGRGQTVVLLSCDVCLKNYLRKKNLHYLYRNQRSFKQKRKAGGNPADPEK